MIGIQINNEFLDLPENIQVEIIRNSPYFGDNEIEGEYSLPIAIPYTNKNYRLLSYIGNHYKEHKKESITATLFSGGGVSYVGTLVIDGFEKNNNNPGSLLTKSLFTFATSSFFQQIKDKKVSSLSLGGIRTFNWTTIDPDDGSNGFWQHVYNTCVTPANYDYSFFPIKNEEYGEIPGELNAPSFKTITWMNMVYNGLYTAPIGNRFFEIERNMLSLCPAIKKSYLIKQIFAEHGWEVDGEVLQDATFNNLYEQSFRAIYWTDYNTNGGVLTMVNKATVNINLAEHVPPNELIQNYIIDLKNRYGIAFVFDKNKRKCTLKWLKNVIAGSSQKDFTKYASAQVKSKFEIKEKIVALSNSIDGADSFPALINNKNVPQIPAVVSTLPSTASVEEGTFCFVYNQNAYYECVYNNDTATKEWQLTAYNIGDFTPANNTDTITTNISTFATSYQPVQTEGGIHSGYVPTCSQPGNWLQNKDVTPWKFRTLIYHGLKQSIKNATGLPTGLTYPYASPINIDNEGNDLGGWVDVYEFVHPTTSVDNGLYKTKWEDWLKIYKKADERTYVIQLPLYELHSLLWEDIIVIQSVQFLIKKMKYTIPYSGLVEVELLKL